MNCIQHPNSTFTGVISLSLITLIIGDSLLANNLGILKKDYHDTQYGNQQEPFYLVSYSALNSILLIETVGIFSLGEDPLKQKLRLLSVLNSLLIGNCLMALSAPLFSPQLLINENSNIALHCMDFFLSMILVFYPLLALKIHKNILHKAQAEMADNLTISPFSLKISTIGSLLILISGSFSPALQAAPLTLLIAGATYAFGVLFLAIGINFCQKKHEERKRKEEITQALLSQNTTESPDSLVKKVGNSLHAFFHAINGPYLTVNTGRPSRAQSLEAA